MSGSLQAYLLWEKSRYDRIDWDLFQVETETRCRSNWIWFLHIKNKVPNEGKENVHGEQIQRTTGTQTEPWEKCITCCWWGIYKANSSRSMFELKIYSKLPQFPFSFPWVLGTTRKGTKNEYLCIMIEGHFTYSGKHKRLAERKDFNGNGCPPQLSLK